MKPHKWAKEIKAWADGEAVEIREVNEGIWDLLDIDGYPPFSDEDYEFRIKPQPKEPQYLYVYMGNFATYHVFREKKVEIADATYIGKIKLEQDDEDN